MPDHRNHRGPHPQDTQLFATENLPALQAATHDLSWLLSHGYAIPSALKLAGDRYALNSRQRTAVSRCSCTDDVLKSRQQKFVRSDAAGSGPLWLDGYNVLTSIEAALSGGAILHARDGCFRDMASMHGSYRKVAETIPAIELLGDVMAESNITAAVWLLDRPVSNSGRLKGVLTDVAIAHGWDWRVDLVPDPDKVLIGCDHMIASADSQVVDGSQHCFNLARIVIEARIPNAWIVDLSDE